MPNMTDDQFNQLQALVGEIGAKKKAADEATKTANDGQAQLTSLQANVGNLQAAEAQTGADEATAIANLTAFVSTLATPTPPTPNPGPTPGPAPAQALPRVQPGQGRHMSNIPPSQPQRVNPANVTGPGATAEDGAGEQEGQQAHKAKRP